MKTTNRTLRTLLVAGLFGFALSSNAQFGNIINKAKNKVTGDVKHAAKKAADKAVDKATQKAKQKAYKMIQKKVLGGKQLPELPWTMSEEAYCDYNQTQQFNGTNVMTWLMACGDVSQEDCKALRDKMLARYKANNKIILAESTGAFESLGEVRMAIMSEVEAEQKRFWNFYGAILHILNLHATGITSKGNSVDVQTASAGLIGTRIDKKRPSSRAIILGMKNDKGRFTDLEGRGIYLEDDELEYAKDGARRILNIGWFLDGFDGAIDDNVSIEKIIDSKVFGEKGFDTDWAFQANRAAMYVQLMGDAINGNSPESIERLSMPKAGAMNAANKAKALALAKAEDSSVIDVVITSKSWNVQRNALGIPTHRTISGYWIRNTKHGKQASSHSWAQDRLGGGKYSALRNYGVGTETFFIK